jgi:hypothetical protein
MIARIWHGYTNFDNAQMFGEMLKNEVLPGIGRIDGYKGGQLLRRNHVSEVEFVTITFFSDMDAIIAFAGEVFEKAVIHEEAGKLLSRYDETVTHFVLEGMVVSEDFALLI